MVPGVYEFVSHIALNIVKLSSPVQDPIIV